MNAHTGRKCRPEQVLGRKCTASCRASFHPPELAEGIPGKGQPFTSEGAQLAHPPGRQLDGPKVRARGTKALLGKGDWGSIFLIHTMRIFLETRPASRVFSSLHGYASPPSVRKRSMSDLSQTVHRGDKRLPLGRRPCDTQRQKVDTATPRKAAASCARIAPLFCFVVRLFDMKKPPILFYERLYKLGSYGHCEKF